MLKSSLYIASGRLIRNYKKNLLIIAITAVSIVLLYFMLIMDHAENYSYNELDSLLSYGARGTGTIRILGSESFSQMSVDDFLKDLIDRKIVTSAGCFSWGGTPGLEELCNSRKYKSEDLLYMTYSATGICDFDIEFGRDVSQLKTDPNDDIMYLYLGSDFKDKCYLNQKFDTEYGTTFVVAGFVKEDTKILDPTIDIIIDSQLLDYSVNLNSQIIVISELAGSDTITFSTSDFTNAKKEIRKIAEENGLIISVESFDDIFKKSSDSYELIQNYLSQASFLVILSTVVIISLIQIEDILSSKREIGVLYAIGFSKTELSISILSENIIKWMVSFCISFPIALLSSKIWFETGKYNQLFEKLFFISTTPQVVIMTFLIILFACAVPILFFRSYSPCELIGGKND